MRSLISRFAPQEDRNDRIIKKKHHRPDRLFIMVIVALSLFGILMVYDSSVAIAIRDFGNPFYFVNEQLKWLFIGTIALIVFSKIDYHLWQRFALPIFCITAAFLVMVFLPGIGVRALGAHRWLNFGFFILQPAELAKFAIILYLSTWLSQQQIKLTSFLLIVGLVMGLVIIEPDLGTAIIILAISLILYFLSGTPVKQFLLLVPAILIVTLVLSVVAPYRFRRLTTFLNPESDPLGASYQIRQVLLALGSGGWFGVGIGQSRQKYEYLPEANTDSIFAIIGEEIGFVGASAVIAGFLFLLWRGFTIAVRSPDMFGKLVAAGISSWIGIQTVINLTAMVALLPLTGVPLPLVSYGGSSLIILLMGLGIMLNISKQTV